MLAQTLLPKIERAFDAWIRARQQGSFRAFLATRTDPSTLTILDNNPELVSQLPDKIRRQLQLRSPTPRRLSTPTLGTYFPQLTSVYKKLARDEDTFESFLERLREQCPTEETLLIFLKENS